MLNGVEQPSAIKVTKLSNQPGSPRKSVLEIAKKIVNRLSFLSELPSNSMEHYAKHLTDLEKCISELAKRDLSNENFIFVQFLRLLVGNKELRQDLNNLNQSFSNKFDSTSDEEKWCSQFLKFVKEFKLLDLSDKMYFLVTMKEKEHFATIKGKGFDEWSFYNLMEDENFQQQCIKAINKESDPFSNRFKKDMDQYIEKYGWGKKL